jgi:hypothetical protein
MTAALLDLAGRVEAATGPDQELDVAIVYALHPDIGKYEGQCIGDDPIFWHEPYRKQRCPCFTASLDAAMTLYVRLPERVPSNPRLATAEALRQRAEAA